MTTYKKIYRETFDHGPGGWIGWEGQHTPGSGARLLELNQGVVVSRGPWWVDYNHAPPGGGHLHLLFILHTVRGFGNSHGVDEAGGPNGYIEGGFPTNMTNAKFIVRIKGEVKLRGSQFCLHIQGNLSRDPAKPNFINQVLVGQPLWITPEWSEQTIHLVPDQSQWVNLGSRFDRNDFYGNAPIADLLRDVNVDIILLFFPADARPLHPVEGDLQKLRADLDYEVDRSFLPEGQIMLDEVRIEFPHSA